jgi:hypothetical protein
VKAPNKGGRPPQDGARRAAVLRVRCAASQCAAYDAAAALEGVDRSTWIRDTLDAAAEKETR